MSQPQSQSMVDTDAPPAAGSLAAILAPRVIIERVAPSVDFGRYPSKGVIGDNVTVEAYIYLDGHDVPGAQLLWRSANDARAQSVPMRALGNDRWRAE